MLVAVHGSYFSNNFGDTLLVKLVCEYVASIVGKSNVFLAVKGNEREQLYIGYPVLPAQRRSEVTHLVFAGGGYWGEPNAGTYKRYRWYLRNYFRHASWVASYSHAKIGFFGLGFGPISSYWYRRVASSILKKAEIILLRDEESICYFKKYGFRGEPSLCVDFALSLSHYADYNKKREGVALHLPNLSREEIDIIVDFVFFAFGKEKIISIIFDTAGKEARSRAEIIRSSALRYFSQSNIALKYYEGVDKTLNDLSGYDLVVTNKLHVGIVTVALGGKVISVPAHSKTFRFYRQMDIDFFCVSREGLSSARLLAVQDNIENFAPRFDIMDEGIKKIKDSFDQFLK